MAAIVLVVLHAQEPSEPSYRTGVDLVLLDVSVTDAHGVPVAGLRAGNFELKEDHVLRELSGFAMGSENISLALAVDFSGSMGPRRGALVQSIRTFVSLLQPRDEAVLLTFNERPTLLTSLALAQSQSREEWASALLRTLPSGKTGLYDAVIRTSEELQGAMYERRVIVILSDGKDTSSAATLNETVAKLQSSNRLVYCVGLFNPGEPDTDAHALRRLASSTGGLALFDEDGKGLTQALTKIMADLRTRYILEFRSPEAPPGVTQVRRLSVTVRDAKGGRLKVRARDEYRAVGASHK